MVRAPKKCLSAIAVSICLWAGTAYGQNDATLSSLTLSQGTLNETFAPENTIYTASVANSVSRITVTPTPTDGNATVVYLDGDDMALTDADPGTPDTFEVNLSVGISRIKVRVTSESGTTTKNYYLQVTRLWPVGRMSLAESTVFFEEGEKIYITVTLDRPAGAGGALALINIEEHEKGVHVVTNYVDVYEEGPAPILIPAGEKKGTFPLYLKENNWRDLNVDIDLSLEVGYGMVLPNASSDKERSVTVIDNDYVYFGLRPTKPYWYENEGTITWELEVVGGAFVNYDFSFVLLNMEAQATRENDYNVQGTIIIPAGQRRVTFETEITNDRQLEDDEGFTITLFKNGLTNNIVVTCHPDSFEFASLKPEEPVLKCIPPKTLDDLPENGAVRVVIKDDDVAAVTLEGLRTNAYYGPGDTITGEVAWRDEDSNCIVPFPVMFDVVVEEQPFFLARSEDTGIRIPPCTRTDSRPFSFPAIAAEGVEPGIHTIRLKIRQTAPGDRRLYPEYPYWPIQVCIPASDVDCSTYIAPPQPEKTTPPQIVPPVEEVNNTPVTQSPPVTQSSPATQSSLPPPSEPEGYLENPGPDSFQSGIGVISGWVCEGDAVEIALNGERQLAAYGTERLDTAAVCGDTDNGFGLLFNWNLLGDGEHEVEAFVDDVELGRATVTVTTLGAEFVRGVTGTCEVADFPSLDESMTLMWHQNSQNFVLVDGEEPRGENRAGTAGVGYLENPGPHSFQSGIGVISGWVCEGDEVMIALNGEGQPAAYGTERLDTQEACGDTDNGFGLLFNWNLLGEGAHTVEAFVDGEELGRATVRVTTVGEGAEEEFVRGVAGECTVEDFPTLDETVTLEWQQNSQNFVITDVE